MSRIFISTAIIKDAFDSVKVEMTVCHSICLQSSFIGTRIFSKNKNINFYSSGFLFGSNLVEAKGFLNSQGVYLGSAFGISTP